MSLNLLNAFRSRRSVKEYLPKEISNEVLFRILEVSRWAPSAHNAQPWRFIVIQDSVTKQRLAKTMASRWDRDMSKNGVPKEQRESLVKISVERFENAPISIIACLTMENMDECPDERRKKIEYVLAVHEIS